MQLLALVPIVFLTFSCDNDTISIKQTGNLSIIIKSATDENIDSATLYLFDMSIFETDISFEYNNREDFAVNVLEQTNSNSFDFGEVNSGNYLVFGEVTDGDSMTYNVSQFAQIVSGTTTTKKIDLADYVGSVQFRVRYYDSYIDSYLSNMNILLVPTQITDVQYMNLDALKAVGIELGQTNYDGYIFANNIPATSYYVVGYYSNGQYDILCPYSSSSTLPYPITLAKNAVTADVLYSDIMYTNNTHIPGDDEETTHGIHVYSIHYDIETGLTDTVNIVRANVIVCEDNESYLSWAIDDAELKLSTDENGFAAIPENTNFYYSNYYIWVYLDNDTYTELGPFTRTEISSGITSVNVSYNKFHREFGDVSINIFTEFSDQSLDTSTSPFIFGNVMLTQSTSSTLPSGYTATTDNTGIASFENIPVGNYFLWAYSDSKHSEKSSTVVTVKADETVQLTEIFTSEKVLQLKGGLHLKIEGTSNESPENIKNVNVVVTKSYTSNLSSAIASALATEKTDASGNVSFEGLEVGENYYVYIYYDLDRFYYNSNLVYTIAYNSNTVHTISTGATFLE